MTGEIDNFGIRRGYGPFPHRSDWRHVPNRVHPDLWAALDTTLQEDRTDVMDSMTKSAAINEGLGRFILARVDGLGDESSARITEALGGAEAVEALRAAITATSPVVQE